MKLINQVKNVSAHFFLLENNDIVYLSTENQIIRTGSVNWTSFFSGFKYPNTIYNNLILCQQRKVDELKEETHFLSLIDGTEIENNSMINFLIVSEIIYDSKLIVKYKDEYKNKVTVLFDLKTESIEWIYRFNIKYYLTHKLGILCKNEFNKKVVFLDTVSGEELWTLDTTALGKWQDYNKTDKQTEVSRVIGEFEEKLYLYLNNGKILVLDIQNGKHLKVLFNDKYNSAGRFNESFDYNIQIDNKNRKLIQLFRHDYTEVNLDTYEVIHDKIAAFEFNKLENTGSIVFDDNYIYFSDRNECKVASFNRQTYEVDWVHALSDPHTGEVDGSRFGKDQKLYGNILYVLDNKHTLHIFKKEISCISR